MKVNFSSQSSAYNQVQAQLSTIDRFIAAEALAKSQNHKPEWDCIIGINYLAGLLGVCTKTARGYIKSGRIPGYQVNGKYYFLIYEFVKAINEDKYLFSIFWKSYNDPVHSPDELIIHWRMFNYPERTLVLFSYQRITATLSLPFNLFGKNEKIISRMIREINKRNAVVPFKSRGL
jgi:hypothetical protein